jgi:hypothetical protein
MFALSYKQKRLPCNSCSVSSFVLQYEQKLLEKMFHVLEVHLPSSIVGDESLHRLLVGLYRSLWMTVLNFECSAIILS